MLWCWVFYVFCFSSCRRTLHEHILHDLPVHIFLISWSQKISLSLKSLQIQPSELHFVVLFSPFFLWCLSDALMLRFLLEYMKSAQPSWYHGSTWRSRHSDLSSEFHTYLYMTFFMDIVAIPYLGVNYCMCSCYKCDLVFFQRRTIFSKPQKILASIEFLSFKSTHPIFKNHSVG